MAGRPAHAIGEPITDIRIRDNMRTEEDTIRAIAGISIGETMDVQTLDMVRERLNSCGLFADVDVYWERHKDGVRINIVIKDKFPWAPVPTFSYSPGNISGGLVVVHGNLFGRGKRGIVGGRFSTADSGAIVGYQDPALFGSWIFYDFAGRFQDQSIPEYGNVPDMPLSPLRETNLRSYGAVGTLGVAWFRRVKTWVEWNLDRFQERWTRSNADVFGSEDALPPGAEGGHHRVLAAGVTFDFRAREHAVMWGNALGFAVEQGHRRWGGDAKFDYWKLRGGYEHGFRLFRRHNLVLRVGGFAGRNLPLWSENWAGGTNLRGFLYRQFAGDTQARSQVEYHFPLVSFGKLDLRGLVFNDAAAVWYRSLPEADPTGAEYLPREDGRRFLAPTLLQPGFDRHRDVHTSVGAGLRFYLRSIAVPLVGVDFGYGLPRGPVRMVLVIGA
jgi:outer membrane protein assembly factor BamA